MQPRPIIIYGQRDRLPDPKPRIVSGKLFFAIKMLSLAAFGIGFYYGPAYVTCRNMKERGLFYYETTMASCMKHQKENGSPLDLLTSTYDTLARTLVRAL